MTSKTAARIKAPQSFYITIHAVSDASPFWFNYVLDVSTEHQFARVTLLRIAPLDGICTKKITVKAKDGVVPSKTVKALAKGLCSINQRQVDEAVANTRSQIVRSVFESADYGIAMKCGESENVIKLPMRAEVDEVKMHRNYSDIDRLWRLPDKLFEAAFRGNPLASNSGEFDVESQRAAEPYIATVRSGAFDKGWSGQPLSLLIRGYQGIVTSDPRPLKAEAQGKNELGLDTYVPALYPPLAVMARIQGNVTVNFHVNSETGEVYSLAAVAGHPMLRQAAVDAVRQWRFRTPLGDSAPTTATIRFVLTCGDE